MDYLNRFENEFRRARKAHAARSRRDIDDLSEKARQRHTRRTMASQRRMVETARFFDDLQAMDMEAF